MTGSLAHIPGSAGLPVLGETVPWLRDARAYVDARRTRGDVVRSRLLGRDMVLLFGADEAREVLLDRDRTWSSHGGWQRTIGTLFRRGLMLRDFDDHHAHRRIMSVAFRREALDGYADLIDEVVRRRLAHLVPGRVDAYGLLKRMTLDIANEVFLGVSLQDRAEAVTKAFVDLVAASITPVRAPLPGTPMTRGLAGRRVLEAELAPLVGRERSRPPTRTLLSQLCHAVDDDGRGFVPARDQGDPRPAAPGLARRDRGNRPRPAADPDPPTPRRASRPGAEPAGDSLTRPQSRCARRTAVAMARSASRRSSRSRSAWRLS
jgi:cytochrome P450